MCFHNSLYSIKLNRAGICYEVGISRISSAARKNGHFRCGGFSDLKIFNLHLKAYLSTEECVVADEEYHGRSNITLRNALASYGKMPRRICTRHKIVNARMKNYPVLYHTLRHSHMLQVLCFHTFLKLTALMTQHPDPLFS